MHIGVPGGSQRQVAMISEACSEHTDFARSSDVNQIGLKAIEYLADDRCMARERGVKAEILFEREREDASWQFEGPHVAVFHKGLTAVARANAEERKILPACECFKMAAGMRNPVNFVKGVGEVRYTRKIILHGVNWNCCSEQLSDSRFQPSEAMPWAATQIA
jgi:hypothetical protein